MGPAFHIMQGAISGAVLYPFAGGYAVIFGVSVVGIDLDHFLEYYIDRRRLDIRGMIEYHDILLHNLDGYLGLNLFHTIECYLLLFVMGLYFPMVDFILLGFLFHHLLDEIQLIKMKKPFVRAFSIAEYFIRKPHYFTTLDAKLEDGKMISKK